MGGRIGRGGAVEKGSYSLWQQSPTDLPASALVPLRNSHPVTSGMLLECRADHVMSLLCPNPPRTPLPALSKRSCVSGSLCLPDLILHSCPPCSFCSAHSFRNVLQAYQPPWALHLLFLLPGMLFTKEPLYFFRSLLRHHHLIRAFPTTLTKLSTSHFFSLAEVFLSVWHCYLLIYPPCLVAVSSNRM